MSRQLSRFERDFADLHGHRPRVFRMRAARAARPQKMADPLAGVPWIGKVGLLIALGLLLIGLCLGLAVLLGGAGLFFLEALRS